MEASCLSLSLRGGYEPFDQGAIMVSNMTRVSKVLPGDGYLLQTYLLSLPTSLALENRRITKKTKGV